MAQVRIKNLTQHRIYIPVPVGIMMRPAQEIILSEVSDDALAQSKKISKLVEKRIIQVWIQPQDPEIDDTLETRFINPGGGLPMHGSTHYDGGSDPIDIDQLRTSGGIPGYIMEAGPGGSISWVPHTVPAHAANHADGGSDEIDIVTLGSTSAPAAGYLAASDGANGLAWVTPSAPGAHAATHSEGGSDSIDAADLSSASATGAGQVPQSDGAGGIDWASGGDIFGPSGATDNAVARYDTATGKLLQDSLVTVDDTGNVGVPALATVDGRDVSADGNVLDTHVADTTNPHATDLGNLGTGTLAELNAVVTDATLDDASAARTPLSHAASHQHSGTDEVATATPAANAIPKADGTGQLAAGWIPVSGSLATLTKEPTGFPNRTDSAISFAPSPNRRFTIAPVGASFSFYINGSVYTKTVAETIDLPNTTGLWFIYYDATGTLQSSLTPWSFGNDTAFVATVYWNTAAPTQTMLGEERHGLVMDWQTHEYLHRVERTRYVSGFATSGFVLDSDVDADVQFGVGNGSIIDEDILMSIVHAATPSNPFEQVLTDPAEIPVVYRDGAGGAWLKDTATTFPFKNVPAGTARIAWNEDVAGTWQQTEVANNDFVAYWIWATNDPTDPIISLQGQRTDGTLVEARANNGFNTLNLGSLPSPEWKLLYRTIYQTGNGFVGTRKAKLQAIDDFRTAEVQPGIASAATSHSSLTDLAVGNDHPQYQLRADRTVHLATVGGDVQSIADGILAATALTPSASAPVVLLVHPGTYSTPPFSLPDYVSLVGVGGTQSAIIAASTTTTALCSANGGQRVQGITLLGASGAGGIGVDVTGTTGTLMLKDCYIYNCETCIRCVGTGYAVEAEHVKAETGTTGIFLNGIGARGRINGLALVDFTTGLHIGSTGGIVTGQYLRVADDTGFTTHVQVEAASGVLSLINSVFRADKTLYNAGAEIAVEHASIVPGDEAVQLTAELHVGTQARPRESCFGGGDSNTYTLGALTNTNLEAGTWADITSNLKFQDGTSATLLPGTGAGNCFYLGADYAFPGFKTTTTTAMVLGTGSVIMEYWNGTAWTSFRHMSTAGSSPWTQYAQDLLTRAASEQVRFDSDNMTGWVTKSLNGVTKYWVRLRVVTAITTAPASDITKNHTHRTEINSDGVVEFFGDAEPRRDLVWHYALEGRLDGNDPGDGTSAVGTGGIDWRGRDNLFAAAALDGKLSGVRVSQGWDTSRSLRYVFGWHPESGATLSGNVEIEVDGYLYKAGDQFDGTKTPDFTVSVITDTSTLSATEMTFSTFDFSVPDALPGDLLILYVRRDATGGNLDDTFGNDVIQVLGALEGVVWRT